MLTCLFVYISFFRRVVNFRYKTQWREKKEGKVMSPEERIVAIRLLEKMEEHREYARKLELVDTSKYVKRKKKI